MSFLTRVLEVLRDFAPLISAAVLFLSVIVAVCGLRLSAIINISQKRIDVMASCNIRFESILKEIHDCQLSDADGTLSARADLQRRILSVYIRYWNLQIDQFLYFVSGFISPDVYAYWVFEKVRSFKNDKEICGVSFEDGYNRSVVERGVYDENFQGFMTQIKGVARLHGNTITQDERKQIIELIKNYYKELKQHRRSALKFLRVY